MAPAWKRPPDSTRTDSIRWDSSWPGFARNEDRAEVLGYLWQRFGIAPSNFDGYEMLETGKSLWLVRKSAHLELTSLFKVFACGMKAFQRIGQFIKPTTRLMQIFGREATCAIMEITSEQLRSLAKGEGIPCNLPVANGYVLLRMYGQYDLGLGLLIRGKVQSQIRKSDLQQISTEPTQRAHCPQ